MHPTNIRSVLMLLATSGSFSVLATGTIAAGKDLLPGSPAQQVLTEAAEKGLYTYLVFVKEDNPSTRGMVETVAAATQKRVDRAASIVIQLSNPAEKATVQRFDVSRAPMPLTIVVAPNGAVTGMFPKKVTDAQIGDAFVTEVMAQCMKAMQEGKLVFVCVQPSGAPVPASVTAFQRDPQFANRTAVVSVEASDESEAKLLEEMQVDRNADEAQIVFMAPPGVLVGKFGSVATKAQMAAALHEAGKCCDDPNCKHGHGATTGNTRQANQATGKRN